MRIFTIAILLLFLNSCGYKEDDIIDFSSELNKVEFCSINLDNTNCLFYRPLFVSLYIRISEKTTLPINGVVLNSRAMSEYRYTEYYQAELKHINDIYKSSNSDYRLIAFKSYLTK